MPFRREFVLVLDTLVSTHGFGPYLGPGVFPHADFSPLRTALPPPPEIRAPPLDGIYEIRQKSVTNAYFRCKITTFFRSSGPRAPQGPIDNMRLPLDVAEIRMVMTMGEKKRRNKDVLALIRTNYCILSDSQKRVADYVAANAELVMTTSLVDLAEGSNVSEPTVFRFLRKLGYDSYQVFRVDLAQTLAEGKDDNFYSEIDELDDARCIRDKVLTSTASCFDDGRHIISAESLERAADRIEKSRHIVTVGVGASFCMAYDMYHKLMRLGISSQVTNDTHMMNILCSRLTADDMLICFSHSGESREVLDALRIAQQGGAYTVAITSYKNSTATVLADCCILSSSHETHYRADSMTSRILQLGIIDMLYILLVLHDRDKRQAEINKSRLAVARNKT